eukprot:6186275-Pleurochrysis_carterae.AAC.6
MHDSARKSASGHIHSQRRIRFQKHSVLHEARDMTRGTLSGLGREGLCSHTCTAQHGLFETTDPRRRHRCDRSLCSLLVPCFCRRRRHCARPGMRERGWREARCAYDCTASAVAHAAIADFPRVPCINDEMHEH